MKVRAAVVVLAMVLIVGNYSASFCHGSVLEVGFYRGKCGFADVEAIVAQVVTAQFFVDPTIVAALLRLQFHDCFVTGCDASILIEGNDSEKTAPPNQTMRGYEIIDLVKDAVENVCPDVVSCADIIAIATRDVVFLSGGGRYNVETGRRDGLVSTAQNLSVPDPSATVSQAIAAFARRGLSVTDMVLLLELPFFTFLQLLLYTGAHSVGVAQCSFIQDRLFDFKSTGHLDPSMDPFLASTLRSRCSSPEFAGADNAVNLDQNPFSPFILDNSYYQNIMLRRGILQIDQELRTHPTTRAVVANLAANALEFPARFGAAMVKLGAIGVLIGSQGEIRRSCRATNTPPQFT